MYEWVGGLRKASASNNCGTGMLLNFAIVGRRMVRRVGVFVMCCIFPGLQNALWWGLDWAHYLFKNFHSHHVRPSSFFIFVKTQNVQTINSVNVHKCCMITSRQLERDISPSLRKRTAMRWKEEAHHENPDHLFIFFRIEAYEVLLPLGSYTIVSNLD